MQTEWDLIIVGAGAAGLFLRATLSPTIRVLLLEAGEQAGRKLLVTGGGMCNLTNTQATDEFLNHFGSKRQRNFLLPALQNFPPTALRTWFSDQGLATEARSDGKVYPTSKRSKDVLDTLLQANTSPIHYTEKVTAVHKEQKSFVVTTAKGVYRGTNVVLATGGMSVPQTGSDGNGYALAKSLGHTIVPPTPALVGVTIENHWLAPYSGQTIDAKRITLTRKADTKAYAISSGEVLITHRGLSGPPILTASGSIQAGDTIALTLIADAHLLLKTAAAQQSVRTTLTGGGISRSLADALLAEAKVDGRTTIGQLRRADRSRITALLSSLSLTISGTGGFTTAMVTRGGVTLGEVDRKSMQSRLSPGLFFAGEVLDYDGQSGGYNLQGAFSTARLITEYLQKE